MRSHSGWRGARSRDGDGMAESSEKPPRAARSASKAARPAGGVRQSMDQELVRSGPAQGVESDRKRSWRKRARKRFKRVGRKALNRVSRVAGRESLVGDRPILDAKDFPWIPRLEEGTPLIQSELAAVLHYRDSLPKLHELQREQYRISADDKWRAFVLYGWDYEAEEGAHLCPETSRLVRQIPGLRTAFFSILDPGAHIPEHRGAIKGLLRGQLALVVPRDRERCVLWLEGVPHLWQEGRVLVFDDTYLHEVRNETDEERVVLILHFDRPMRWRGRLLHRALLLALRRTSFIKSARANHAEWARRFRRDR